MRLLLLRLLLLRLMLLQPYKLLMHHLLTSEDFSDFLRLHKIYYDVIEILL